MLVMGIQRVQQVLKRLDERMVRQSIVDSRSLFTRRNQVEVCKLAQMLGGGGATQAQFFGNLA